ncbi:MAG: ABC transporter substrate-binding protein [Hyphomicrobiaceae bacterium]
MHKIRLAENFRAVFYAPFYATLALGFAAREGVEVTLVNSATPGAGTMSLMDGSIDVTWGGPMRVMKARDEAGGPPLVCFCEVVRRDPFYLVMRPDAAPFALGDLARLRLGSVSEVPTPWLCLQHDLREIGLDPARVNRIADRTMVDNLAALGRGDIDIAQMFEPFASMAERQGIGKIVHAASARGETSYTTLLATRDGMVRNREAFAALARAAGHMQGWLAQHSAADLAEAVASYFTQVERADLVTAFQRYQAAQLWSRGGTAVSRAGFARLAASLESGGFIARQPAYEDCVADALLS